MHDKLLYSVKIGIELYGSTATMTLELNEAVIVSLLVVVASTMIVAERQASEHANGSETHRRSWKFPTGLVLWITASAACAISGALQCEPRLMMMVILPALIGFSMIALTSIGLRIAQSTPWFALIGFHSFRIIIELVFHQLHLQNRLPIQATYHGLNFDILTGFSACVLCLWAIIARLPKIVIIVWNTAGMVLVTTIIVIASLSMPGPLRKFINEPSTIVLSTFPFVWVPSILAPVALAGHLVIYRKLMQCQR